MIEIKELVGTIRHKLAEVNTPDILVRNRSQDILYVAGGPHPSGDPEGTLQLGFDLVLIGEGEITFPRLLNAYFSHSDYHLVQGVAFWKGDGCYQANERPFAG